VKATIAGAEIEGEPEEVARVLQAMQADVTVSKSSDSKQQPIARIERIAEYIRSKPEYAHSWAEIRAQFADREIRSRGSRAHLYRLLYWRTQLARKKIENEEKGKFKRDDGTYKFMK